MANLIIVDDVPEWQNPEIVGGVMRGIKSWLASDTGQRSGAQDWLDRLAQVNWGDEGCPSWDDIENLSFITNSLFSQMDAGNWLSRLFDADGVFTIAVGMLIDELADVATIKNIG